MSSGIILIDENDNVAVSLKGLSSGDSVSLPDGRKLSLADDIAAGHKIAIEDIDKDADVIKYGASIGQATSFIREGQLVHTGNLKTGLSENIEYSYDGSEASRPPLFLKKGKPLNLFRRINGRCGIRNEIWVVPTVGCVNGIARNIVDEFNLKIVSEEKSGSIDGVYSFSHPYGCSQLGKDHDRTRSLLQNMVLHPNAGGVLVLGLGCENNQIKTFIETMPEDFDQNRIRFLEAQDVDDEIEAGLTILEDLYSLASMDKREQASWNDLTIGLECGGSDAFSGITANPLIGMISDNIVANGGTTVLTEVPEMFGAENVLMKQCADQTIFNKTVDMINEYKAYYQAHDQPIYENPSPGNKAGGISTLEDKSLGCIRKAGTSEIVDVVRIDQRIIHKGVNLLYSPGNDIVATTSLGTSGCQLVLFSTGRGTPLGGFIPTMKISSNSVLADRKKRWIDFDAGVLANDGVEAAEVAEALFDEIISIVNGRPVAAERSNIREIALFKTGVTL